jgi:N-acetylneuraminate synthase
MVYIAHAMGAHVIKFQIHVLDNEMLRETPQSANFAEPLYETLDKTNLTLDRHRELKRLCESLGILYLCTPFSRRGTDMLEELGVAAYKTGSGELTNLPLIEHIGRKGKPMIVSTGMCTIDEVAETVAVLRRLGTPFILTHCVSAYPTPYDRVNLGMIPRYRELFDVPVGLSDHSRGIYTALGAVALGACVLEKHFTLDRQQPGPDHPVSIEPDELGELVKGADAIFRARGAERTIFPEEKEIVAWARESVVSEVAIPRGSIITEAMVWVKRPSPGPGVVPAKDLKQVIGKTAKVDIPKDSQIRWEHLHA